MSRLSTGALSIGMTLLLAGCGSKAPYNPFRVPPEQLRSRVKVVALPPMDAPRDLEDPSAAMKKLLGMIEVELRRELYPFLGRTTKH